MEEHRWKRGEQRMPDALHLTQLLCLSRRLVFSSFLPSRALFHLCAGGEHTHVRSSVPPQLMLVCRACAPVTVRTG